MHLPRNFVTHTLVTLLLFCGTGNIFSTTPAPDKEMNVAPHLAVDPCPADDETNKRILEEYLTISEWSDARQETNTVNLTTAQIQILQDSSHSNVCQEFNNEFQGFLTEKWPDDNTRKYAVSYYKVGNFYFVVISLQQSEDPNTIVSGVAYLTVYNTNLTRIKAYAF